MLGVDPSSDSVVPSHNLNIESPYHSNLFRAVVIGVFVFLVFLLVAYVGFLYGQKFSETEVTFLVPKSSATPNNSTENAMLYKESASGFGELVSVYTKRQFSSEDKILDGEIPYPEEITKLKDEELEEMKCTGSYVRAGLEATGVWTHYNVKSKEWVGLEDKKIFDLVERAQRFLKVKYLYGFDYCQALKGSEFIFSEADDSKFYLLTSVETNFKVIKSFAMVSSDTCSPLLLTKDRRMYFECTGGDASGWSNIYKLNLAGGEPFLIKHCDFDLGGTPEVTCK